MAFGNKLLHIAIEEGEQYGPNMRAVLIGIGKYYYLVVLQTGYVKILAYAGAYRGYYGAELLVLQHLIYALLFNV